MIETRRGSPLKQSAEFDIDSCIICQKNKSVPNSLTKLGRETILRVTNLRVDHVHKLLGLSSDQVKQQFRYH